MSIRLTLVVVVVVLAGCGGAEERCNAARVSANDAWQPVQDALAPQCSFFDVGGWRRAHQDGLDGMGRSFVGQASAWDSAAGRIGMCMETYEPVLRTACRDVATARTSTTAGAVAARDSSRAASDSVHALEAGQEEFVRCVAAVSHPEARALVEAARAHAAAIAASGLAALRDTATTASDASFAACKTVAP